jgi:hypothetical protein
MHHHRCNWRGGCPTGKLFGLLLPQDGSNRRFQFSLEKSSDAYDTQPRSSLRPLGIIRCWG